MLSQNINNTIRLTTLIAEPEPERGAVQHGETDVQPRPDRAVQDHNHGDDRGPDGDAGKA